MTQYKRPTEVEFGSLTLSQEQVANAKVVPKGQWIRSHNPHLHVEEKVDELVISLTAYVFADQEREVYWMVAHPATWWQHFKQAVFLPLTKNPSTRLGRWLFDKSWPVLERKEYKTKVRTKVCPHLDIPPTFNGEDVHIKWLKDEVTLSCEYGSHRDCQLDTCACGCHE